LELALTGEGRGRSGAPVHRRHSRRIPPLFDRLHRLILAAHPDAAVTLTHKMPTYKVGNHHLHRATWKHGVSVYGWRQGDDAGFTIRHAELMTGKGTVQLRLQDAAGIPDAELRDLICAALG